MTAVRYLLSLGISFRIGGIRLAVNGVVKIILDWDFEATVGGNTSKANLSYVAVHLSEIMRTLGPGRGITWARRSRHCSCHFFFSELL